MQNLTTQLAAKQDVIADGDLTIARTTGLQTALNSKQPTIGTDDVQISHVQNLTTQLAAKQPTIGTDDVQISHVQNLTTQLAAKQPTIGTDDVQISHVQNLTTQLAAKQPTIGTDDVQISHVQNLTTQLAALAPKASPVFTGSSTFSGAVNMSGGDLTLSSARKLILNNSGNGEAANSYADDLQVYKYNGAGITIGSPMGKINSIAFADQNNANRNLIRAYSTVLDSRNIGMHCFSNQADTEVPSLSITDGFIGINKAQPTAALDCVGDVEISGNVNLAAGKAFKVNGVAVGVNQSSDYTWTGDHTFTGDVSFAQPIVRYPMTVVETVNAVGSKLVLSKDVAAYLYAHPNIQSTADNTHWQLPSDATVGTRIVIFSYTGGDANGRVTVYTDGTQKLYQANSATDKGSSGVVGKKNDKKFFVMIIAGTSGVWTT